MYVMASWTKDLPAESAAAYQNSFSESAIGQYTDTSEQHPVVGSIRPSENSLFLDAGCGNGRFLTHTAPGQPFVGMDLSLEMVKLARHNLGRGMFVVGELEHLPFRNDVFDEIVSVRVLQHIKDQQRAVKELARTCKPGGHVIVLALNSWTLHCLYKNIHSGSLGRAIGTVLRWLSGGRVTFSKWPFRYDNYCSLPELCRLFREAGLGVVEKKGGTVGFPWVFHSFGWARRLQRYAYRPLCLYFRLCRRLEDRLEKLFPFPYFLDKVIVSGRK